MNIEIIFNNESNVSLDDIINTLIDERIDTYINENIYDTQTNKLTNKEVA